MAVFSSLCRKAVIIHTTATIFQQFDIWTKIFTTIFFSFRALLAFQFYWIKLKFECRGFWMGQSRLHVQHFIMLFTPTTRFMQSITIIILITHKILYSYYWPLKAIISIIYFLLIYKMFNLNPGGWSVGRLIISPNLICEIQRLDNFCQL